MNFCGGTCKAFAFFHREQAGQNTRPHGIHIQHAGRRYGEPAGGLMNQCIHGHTAGQKHNAQQNQPRAVKGVQRRFGVAQHAHHLPPVAAALIKGCQRKGQQQVARQTEGQQPNGFLYHRYHVLSTLFIHVTAYKKSAASLRKRRTIYLVAGAMPSEITQ